MPRDTRAQSPVAEGRDGGISPGDNEEGATRVIRDVRIPVRDGAWLAADLVMPASPGPHPAVMEVLPYRKDDLARQLVQAHEYFARRGYVGVRIDCRGTGASPGRSSDEYSRQDQEDAHDACEWIAAQPWCTGAVGAFGTSYGGYTSCQLAASHPVHLRAIAPMYGFDDRYMDDCHYDGGQLQVYDIGRYGTRMLATNALPPYPESAGARWTEMWKERLEESESWLIHWLSHQTDGPYWRRGSVRDQIADIDCAVLMWGGWQDGYINPIFRMYPKLRGPKRVIIGPWMHSRPDIGPPGPLVDWLDETTRWWDQWLKGTDTGVMDLPPVVFYMQQFDPPCSDRKHTSGYWRQADTLRPPSAKTLTMKLRAGGQMGRDANTRPGQDRLKCDATTGLYAGEFSAGGLPWFGLPLDQAAGEDRALVYTGSPLEGPVEIFGNPSVRLYVSATARVAVFAARLCDVAPDGQAALVSKGVLNATRRDSFVAPEPLEPDSVYQLDIDLNATAWRFEPGHRIRLCVSNAEFPRLWPTPEPLVSTLYRSEQHPSCLRLPIISVGDPSRAATPLTVLERAEPEEHGLENPYQRAVRDLLNDAVEVQAGFTQKVILDTGVEVSDRREFTTRVSNREPARAHATGHTEIQLRRGDWSVIADARSDVTSSSDALHVVQNLRVWLNGELFHDRRWQQSIPRDLI